MDSVLKLHLSVIPKSNTERTQTFCSNAQTFGLIKLCYVSVASFISSPDAPHHTYLAALSDF